MKGGVYRITNQLIDRATGYGVSKGLKESMAFDHLDREQIEQYQKQQFLKLSIIAAKSDFYSPYAKCNFEEFPLMNREQYTQVFPRLATNSTKAYHKIRSTGSTGSPVTLHVTKEMLLAKRISHQKMLKWHGLSRESSEMKLGGESIGFTKYLYYFMRNKRYVDSYQVNNENIPNVARKYNIFKPEVLYGYPSVINDFIMQAKMAGITLRSPELIVVHAENLYNEVKDRFMDFFPDTGIANQYWATESSIAETCPHGKLHLAEDSVICEVIEPDTNGFGDLYITNLYSYSVPLIRYKLGDRIRLSNKLCSCGMKTKVIDTIEGREMEYLDLPGGQKFPVTSLHFSEFTDNILTYQLIYYKKQNRVTLKYVPIRNNLPVMEDRLYAYWVEHLHIKVDFQRVTRMDYSAGGKFKKIVVVE